MAEPLTGITDLYAFPSPEHSGRLVLVLNTLPFAPPSAVFSDGLIYRFRLRPLTANTQQDGAPFAAGGDESVIDCVFSAPAGGHGARGPEQDGTCSVPTGGAVSTRFARQSLAPPASTPTDWTYRGDSARWLPSCRVRPSRPTSLRCPIPLPTSPPRCATLASLPGGLALAPSARPPGRCPRQQP
jgi:hypothetical protein